jgi:hypothetical protein
MKYFCVYTPCLLWNVYEEYEGKDFEISDSELTRNALCEQTESLALPPVCVAFPF